MFIGAGYRINSIINLSAGLTAIYLSSLPCSIGRAILKSRT